MSDKEYEVFERFSIVADDYGDMIAMAMIRKTYGVRWENWLMNKLYKRG